MYSPSHRNPVQIDGPLAGRAGFSADQAGVLPAQAGGAGVLFTGLRVLLPLPLPLLVLLVIICEREEVQ